VWIVLEGRVGTVRNEDDSDMLQMAKLGELVELLTGLARKENRRTSRLSRRFSSMREDYERQVRWAGLEVGKGWAETFEKGAVVGLRNRAFGAEWSHSVISIENALVLSIDTRNLFFWLNHCFQAKLERSFSLLRSHSCFSQLDDLLLEDIVTFMTHSRRRAHQTIYCQGDPATHIYFLEEGELHI
jgi:CRP-like cAMP-binding protein